MPTIVMHNVRDMKVSTFSPANNNFVRLNIMAGDEIVTFELFSMPEELAIRLCRAFGDAETDVRTADGRETLIDYLTVYDVTQKMEGEK